jgi:L-amino acid N-acyltransferase YncA
MQSNPMLRTCVRFTAITLSMVPTVSKRSLLQSMKSADDFDNVRARGLPWLVAEMNEAVVGFCCVSPCHCRSAYRFTLQSFVHVDRTAQNLGVGLALLQAIVQTCQALGYRQIMATITDSRNEGALKLHASAGYRTIGHAVRVAVKFGLWTDIVYMQRALGDSNEPPSAEAPIGYLIPTDQTGP